MVSSSSSVLLPAMVDGEYTNWAELPPELTSSILQRLCVIDVLENAQKVCTWWRRVCKDPAMWRKIGMHNHGESEYDLEIMCRHAVDRSQGGLVEIDIRRFGTDELLKFIADSSSNLTSLKLAMCWSITNKGLIEAVAKLPLLEEFEVSYCVLSADSLKIVGKSCSNLKTLKLNKEDYMLNTIECDDDALAIAGTMPGLRHLQLVANRLSNSGLKAILDNCPNLEHLDLRYCFNVKLDGDLKKRCSESIKVVRHPHDSTLDYPYEAMLSFLKDESDSDFSGDSDYSDYEPHCDYYDRYDFRAPDLYDIYEYER